MEMVPWLLSDDLNLETTEVISPALTCALHNSSIMQIYCQYNAVTLQELRITESNTCDSPVLPNSNLERMTLSSDETRKAENKK